MIIDNATKYKIVKYNSRAGPVSLQLETDKNEPCQQIWSKYLYFFNLIDFFSSFL